MDVSLVWVVGVVLGLGRECITGGHDGAKRQGNVGEWHHFGYFDWFLYDWELLK